MCVVSTVIWGGEMSALHWRERSSFGGKLAVLNEGPIRVIRKRGTNDYGWLAEVLSVTKFTATLYAQGSWSASLCLYLKPILPEKPYLYGFIQIQPGFINKKFTTPGFQLEALPKLQKGLILLPSLKLASCINCKSLPYL
ncbi:hypothetical protein DSO57_1021089 [Entomophthora muscae]|uniref:Uncharacterized protein n=1 Tax=Entomophthora muscae TaxID=34485 RepID=A0ACC2TF26_9FUNG|nr:hypothetical protein DSO57_1021089 [Entomophthora muscae]